MSRNILIKPLVTEKSTRLQDKRNQYSFVVDRTANKIEIGKAIEAKYGVTVKSVNTITTPTQFKSLFRKGKMVPGQVSGYKKAIITLPLGESIEIFAANEE